MESNTEVPQESTLPSSWRPPPKPTTEVQLSVLQHLHLHHLTLTPGALPACLHRDLSTTLPRSSSTWGLRTRKTPKKQDQPCLIYFFLLLLFVRTSRGPSGGGTEVWLGGSFRSDSAGAQLSIQHAGDNVRAVYARQPAYQQLRVGGCWLLPDCLRVLRVEDSEHHLLLWHWYSPQVSSKHGDAVSRRTKRICKSDCAWVFFFFF